MTAEEHYTEAERLLANTQATLVALAEADVKGTAETMGYWTAVMTRDVAIAQVHATLAHARFQQVKR